MEGDTSSTKAYRAPSDNAGCYSAYFTTYNAPYSRVSGMVVGYQKGSTDGFLTYVRKTSINDPYLDGVSITCGSPRKHIWSYAEVKIEISSIIESQALILFRYFHNPYASSLSTSLFNILKLTKLQFLIYLFL